MIVQRWWNKANAYSAGWESLFQAVPSVHNVCLGLSVAEHETRCGDAWPGEFNWGAIQKRGLKPAEQSVLDNLGLFASPKNVGPARSALAAAGFKPVQEALHVDSSPGRGWYFKYFWAFEDDTAAAACFIRILAKNRAACKAVLESAESTVFDLAREMYISGYYEGFHPGGRSIIKRVPPLTAPENANIGDYAGALGRYFPKIREALSLGWTHGTKERAPMPPFDPKKANLFSTAGIQEVLNHLGWSLAVDGVNGPNTDRAIRAFQGKHGLVTDGVVGPATRAVLAREIGKV